MSVNRCIKCGDIIPEGRLSCPNCECIENVEDVLDGTDYNRYIIEDGSCKDGV